jgi:hypothetical protein
MDYDHFMKAHAKKITDVIYETRLVKPASAPSKRPAEAKEVSPPEKKGRHMPLSIDSPLPTSAATSPIILPSPSCPSASALPVEKAAIRSDNSQPTHQLSYTPYTSEEVIAIMEEASTIPPHGHDIEVEGCILCNQLSSSRIIKERANLELQYLALLKKRDNFNSITIAASALVREAALKKGSASSLYVIEAINLAAMKTTTLAPVLMIAATVIANGSDARRPSLLWSPLKRKRSLLQYATLYRLIHHWLKSPWML